MTDELITFPRSALEEALFEIGMGSTIGSMLERTRAGLAYATRIMAALEPTIQANARSDRARNAAMVKHHGTQFQPTLPPADPAVAPQTPQNEPQALISPAPLPSPVPNTAKKRRRTKAEMAAAAVAQQLALNAPMPAQPVYPAPQAQQPVPMGPPFSEPFTATPMPAAPFAPPAHPAPQAQPATVFIPPPPPQPGMPPNPPHPFGVRPE